MSIFKTFTLVGIGTLVGAVASGPCRTADRSDQWLLPPASPTGFISPTSPCRTWPTAA